MFDLIINISDYLVGSLLEIFNMDLSYFETTVPITATIVDIVICIGWALLIGNLVFQALKSMASGLGFEGEDPRTLFTHTFVFAFLLAFSRDICDLGLGFTKKSIEMIQIPSAMALPQINENLFVVPGDASWLLAIIVGIILVVQIIKLFFEIGERYVVLAALTILSPLAFAMGGSKNTGDIFKEWARMFGSMCLIMVLNVVFLKLLLSSMENVPQGAAILPWMILVVAIARVACKIDAIITKIGLNPASTGDPLTHSRMPGMFSVMAAKSIMSSIGRTAQNGKTTNSKNAASSSNPSGALSSSTPSSSRPGSLSDTPKRPSLGGTSKALSSGETSAGVKSSVEMGSAVPKALDISPPKAATAKGGTTAHKATSSSAVSAKETRTGEKGNPVISTTPSVSKGSGSAEKSVSKMRPEPIKAIGGKYMSAPSAPSAKSAMKAAPVSMSAKAGETEKALTPSGKDSTTNLVTEKGKTSVIPKTPASFPTSPIRAAASKTSDNIQSAVRPAHNATNPMTHKPQNAIKTNHLTDKSGSSSIETGKSGDVKQFNANSSHITQNNQTKAAVSAGSPGYTSAKPARSPVSVQKPISSSMDNQSGGIRPNAVSEPGTGANISSAGKQESVSAGSKNIHTAPNAALSSKTQTNNHSSGYNTSVQPKTAQVYIVN